MTADSLLTRLTPHLICAGPKVTMSLDDMFWGDRYGKLEDLRPPMVGTHIRDPSLEEMQKPMEQMGS